MAAPRSPALRLSLFSSAVAGWSATRTGGRLFELCGTPPPPGDAFEAQEVA
jgi:hypothetical protein